ncbi:MAG: UxaA family hydrolase, partial [Anaerolineales bacterium]|nr:UxaA family hydrolase [Anaerolineales bacterium]
MNGELSAPPSLPCLWGAALRLHPQDDVAIARRDLQPGESFEVQDGALVTLRDHIPSGHKLALRQVADGEAVHRYGGVIGFAMRTILPGEHVHIHNLGLGDPEHWQASGVLDRHGVETHSVEILPEHERRTFLGYR